MTESRIEFSLGSLSFSGAGSADWVAAQFEKVVERLPSLLESSIAAQGSIPQSRHSEEGASNELFTTSLAFHIKEKGGDAVQVKRFLVVADWLRRKGVTALSTAAVSKALLDNHQKKLGNPAECLNGNVRQGYCEKHGDGFYITPEGLKSLGYGD